MPISGRTAYGCRLLKALILSLRQLSDPAYQTRKFYDKLLRVDGWQGMRLTEAAQAVQISAFPEAYEKHTPAATSLVDALTVPAPCV